MLQNHQLPGTWDMYPCPFSSSFHDIVDMIVVADRQDIHMVLVVVVGVVDMIVVAVVDMIVAVVDRKGIHMLLFVDVVVMNRPVVAGLQEDSMRDNLVVVVDRMLKGLFLDKPDEESMLLDNILVVALVVPMDKVPVVVVDIVAVDIVVQHYYYTFEYYRLITNKERTVDGGGSLILVHDRLGQFSKL